MNDPIGSIFAFVSQILGAVGDVVEAILAAFGF